MISTIGCFLIGIGITGFIMGLCFVGGRAELENEIMYLQQENKKLREKLDLSDNK